MSPQGRSRTRRIFRSYQQREMSPQAPHAVFFPVVQGGQRGLSGHRKLPPRFALDEIQGSGRHLAGIAVFASGNRARFCDRLKRYFFVESTALFTPISPTRRDEDPIFKNNPKRLLVTGLGGGAMPLSLRRNHPKLMIDVIEIDSDIILVANRFFGVKADLRLKIHAGDAYDFIRKSDQSFDVIVLDVFKSKDNDLWMPPPLLSADFFRSAQKRLSRDGVVVLNLVGRLKGKAGKTLAVIRKLEKIFPQVYLFPIFLKKAPNLAEERNIITICTMDKKRLSNKSILQRARLLAAGKKHSFRDLPHYAENYFPLAKS